MIAAPRATRPPERRRPLANGPARPIKPTDEIAPLHRDTYIRADLAAGPAHAWCCAPEYEDDVAIIGERDRG